MAAGQVCQRGQGTRQPAQSACKWSSYGLYQDSISRNTSSPMLPSIQLQHTLILTAIRGQKGVFELFFCPELKNSILTVQNVKEKQQILIFKGLEPASVWHIHLKNDWNDYSITKIVSWNQLFVSSSCSAYQTLQEVKVRQTGRK